MRIIRWIDGIHMIEGYLKFSRSPTSERFCSVFLPSAGEVAGGYVFSLVCQSIQGVACNHYPWCTGPLYRDPRPTPWYGHLVAKTEDLFKPVQYCSLGSPPVLTSGGYSSMLGGRAGRMHPTVMISCCGTWSLGYEFKLHRNFDFRILFK